jgi:predicted metal-dependent phosphoesterase TrpH
LPESPPVFDLQCHSEQSDGALRPSEVVRLAAQAGVEVLSLTDHDSVDGVPEARETAATLGLRLVSGVEISALDAGQRDLLAG